MSLIPKRFFQCRNVSLAASSAQAWSRLRPPGGMPDPESMIRQGHLASNPQVMEQAGPARPGAFCRADASTLAAYDRDAAAHAAKWHDQPTPFDLRGLIDRHFKRGPTADIGCGSGREVAWLNKCGYPAVGYDASPGLLAEARARYPRLDFRAASLPTLAGVPERSFANVLCEMVITHLPVLEIGPAVRRLAALLQPGGTLCLSWPTTGSGDRRDVDGRLYTAIDLALVLEALGPVPRLHHHRTISASSGECLNRLFVRV